MCCCLCFLVPRNTVKTQGHFVYAGENAVTNEVLISDSVLQSLLLKNGGD